MKKVAFVFVVVTVVGWVAAAQAASRDELISALEHSYQLGAPVQSCLGSNDVDIIRNSYRQLLNMSDDMKGEMSPKLKRAMEMTQELQRIVHDLHLADIKGPLDIGTSLLLTVKLHLYVAQRHRTDESVVDMSATNVADLTGQQLYLALTEKRAVCTADALLLKVLLALVGIDSYFVEAKYVDVTPDMHVLLLIKIGDHHYFFDPNAERNCRTTDEVGTPGWYKLCVAGGLGYDLIYAGGLRLIRIHTMTGSMRPALSISRVNFPREHMGELLTFLTMLP